MWHYERDGRPTGPVAIEEIRNLIAAGRITGSTLVWREGFTGWMAAERTELAASLPPAGPPPLGTPGFSAAASPAYAPAAPAYASAAPATPAFAATAVTNVHFAGFWIRFGAYLIDIIIVETISVVVGGIIGVVIGGVYGAMHARPNTDFIQGTVALLVFLIGLAIGIGYFVVIPATSWQATPGKRMVGIHVIRTNGKKLGFWFAFGRYLSYFLSSIILYFGFFMIGWTSEKRALHDMICGTRVIYGRSSRVRLNEVF